MRLRLIPLDAGRTQADGGIELVSRGSGDPGEKFWKIAKRAAENGKAGVIIVVAADELTRITDNQSGYVSDIPVLAIKESDAERLRRAKRAVLVHATSANMTLSTYFGSALRHDMIAFARAASADHPVQQNFRLLRESPNLSKFF